jgi:hypothetical protein
MDNYAEWMFQFESAATPDRGFKDEPLNKRVLDELYDEGKDVNQAIYEYLWRTKGE